MTTTLRSLRILDTGSVLVLLVAGVIYFWPARAEIPGGGVLPAAPVMVNDAVSGRFDDSDAAKVVASNILSSSRRAPTVRYASPDLLPAADYSMPAAFAAAPASDSAAESADDADAPPALYGIVNTDGTWRALLRLTESDAAPVLLREGDRRGSYVVKSIRPNAVVVAGPSGQRTLRLSRPSRTDSTGKPQ